MSAIDLMLDEENELTFQLSVEGTRPAEASARLIVNSSDMSLVFEAEEFSNGEVSVILPPLHHVLKEGKYDIDLEVIVDDRYFKPLTLEGNFEKSLVVKAAPVTKRKKRKQPSVTIVETTSKDSTPTVTVNNSRTRSKAAMLASSIRAPKASKKPQQKNIVETKRVVKGSDISDEDILNIIKALTKQQ